MKKDALDKVLYFELGHRFLLVICISVTPSFHCFWISTTCFSCQDCTLRVQYKPIAWTFGGFFPWTGKAVTGFEGFSVPNQLESSRVESSLVESSPVESSRVELSRVESSRVVS